jgi:glycosyltransferase involved in cell wall biosynthesis
MKEREGTLVFITPSLGAGGAESVCVQLANDFASKGYRVELWAMNLLNAKLQSRISSQVKLIDLQTKRLRWAPWAILKETRRSDQITFIAFNQYLALSLLVIRFLFIKRYRVVSRLIINFSARAKTENKLNRFLGYPLTKLILPLSDLIVAQCQAMKDDVVNFWSINPDHIRVINNPVPMQSVTVPLDQRPLDVLFVGRLDPQKGIHHLLSAFLKIVQLEPKVILKIIGEGHLENELRILTEKLGLTHSVSFLGYQSDVSPFYRQARLTLLSSLYEGFPNVLIESISHGTPVVSFDCPSGPAEIVQDGVNGFLVRLGDERAFAEKVIEGLRAGTFNSETVRESSLRFGINAIGDQYEKAIFETQPCAE